MSARSGGPAGDRCQEEQEDDGVPQLPAGVDTARGYDEAGDQGENRAGRGRTGETAEPLTNSGAGSGNRPQQRADSHERRQSAKRLDGPVG
ncbi:hypothetical protein [Streptomyces finlayi]|uniref:hypothetical protein n=1 Tax=Streptomyces finlayi TaxID=67296 RepID=UPI0021560265|nr:hypothetical protein [Streptomyces finlayi]